MPHAVSRYTESPDSSDSCPAALPNTQTSTLSLVLQLVAVTYEARVMLELLQLLQPTLKPRFTL